MRNTLLLVFITVLQAHANDTYSQNTKLTLNLNNVTVANVLEEIQNNSEFYFLFNAKLIDVKREVSISMEDKKISEILTSLFSGSGVNYLVYDRQIILTPSNVTSLSAAMQQLKITGTVTDKNGPIPGANVVVTGTTLGAITDLNGKFSIEVPQGAKSLTFTFVGMEPQEITIGTLTRIDVTMTESAIGLEEVVVIGYGTQKKSDLTGAISNISGNELKNLPVRSVADALQGKLAGVMVTSTGGSPGNPPAVRIRGVGTVNNNNPLYIVDGLPQSDIGWLNPNDIASMEVLKDASATAIYGSRAANGVIIISTVRGNEDQMKTQVTFDTYYGIQNPIKIYKVMNASDFIDYKNLASVNAGNAPFSTADQKAQILQFLKANTGSEEGTNWWKEISEKNAPVQNYNLGVSGGSKNLSYHTNLEYMSQKGIVKGSDYNRISWLTNFDNRLFDWLKMSGNFGLIDETRKITNENSAWGTIWSAFTADPISPVYRIGLKDIPSFLAPALFMDQIDLNNRYSWYSPILLTNKQNPVAEMDILNDNISKNIKVKGGLSLDANITKWLRFKTNFGVDLNRGDADGFSPKYYLDGDQYTNDATVSKYYSNSDYWVWDNVLTFDKEFGVHHILAMMGTSAEDTKSSATSASRQGLVNNDPNQRILDAASKNPDASGWKAESSLSSVFGRFFYSYGGKYMITANIRRDGSSNFGLKNKWGIFPSLSVAWNFYEESFMKDLDWLSRSKLRLSWGQIGNQAIGNGAYLSTYTGNLGYYLFGSNFIPQGMGGSNSIGNPDVKWETTDQADIGLDLGFFKDKLNVTVDYFRKTTNNMLLQVPLPSYLGFPNNPWVNKGSILNKGLEMDLQYKNTVGDFTYSIGGNLFTFENKVLSLGGGEPIYGGPWISVTTTKTEVGMPVGYFYGLKTDGIFQDETQIKNYINKEGELIQPMARPGDLKFLDLNGDGKISADDRTDIGNSFPKVSYGFNFTGAYKGFDLQLAIQGVYGNKIMNIKKIDTNSGVGWYNAPADLMDIAWSPTNHTNEQFQINSNNTNNLQISDWLVEDGSYLRLKNIQIGYSLPKVIMSKMQISKIRFWIGAYNILTLMKYTGLDPEIGNNSPLSNGVDNVYYPQPKSYMIGINATF